MLATPLNAYLGRALKRSPRAQELCLALEGRRIELQIEGLPGGLYLSASGGALRASAGPGEAPADVSIHASPLGLLALAGNDASEAVLRGAARVEGDEQLVHQVQELARLLRPDIEHALGQIAGRVPAHLATRALTLFSAWARGAGESVARNTADYLAHESRDLVPRAEAESQFEAIEALRAAVAQAEARAARIAEQVGELKARSAS